MYYSAYPPPQSIGQITMAVLVAGSSMAPWEGAGEWASAFTRPFPRNKKYAINVTE